MRQYHSPAHDDHADVHLPRALSPHTIEVHQTQFDYNNNILQSIGLVISIIRIIATVDEQAVAVDFLCLLLRIGCCCGNLVV